MIKTLVTLSESHIQRIKSAYERKASLRIYLSYEKIKQTGEYALLLTESQRERLDKKETLKKGVILELKYEQLKTNHSGGFLSILFAALGALGALAGGSAAIANAVKTSQHQSAEEEEMKRHNREMDKLAKGSGVRLRKKKDIEVLSDADIERLVKDLKIKHFRGVFMKDELPQKINTIECGIINLENFGQEGSHWTAYYKNNNKKYYFDSYGEAPPPKQLVRYLGSKNLIYNRRFQGYYDPPICGHLCFIVLKELSKGRDYNNVLQKIEGVKENFF